MIYLSASGPLALENVARMAKPRDIPILVDAAAEVLTIPNVHLQRGATVVAYSGGKAICGPQCAYLGAAAESGGHLRWRLRNSNVPWPLIVWGPLKNSIAVASGRFIFVS